MSQASPSQPLLAAPPPFFPPARLPCNVASALAPPLLLVWCRLDLLLEEKKLWECIFCGKTNGGEANGGKTNEGKRGGRRRRAAGSGSGLDSGGPTCRKCCSASGAFWTASRWTSQGRAAAQLPRGANENI